MLTLELMQVVSVGAQHHWPWEAIVIFGYTGIGMITVGLSVISVTYAVDSYKPIAGQIMTTCTVFKNTFDVSSDPSNCSLLSDPTYKRVPVRYDLLAQRLGGFCWIH
jgi:hypothetical protein